VRRDLAQPAVFGGFDGMASMLGPVVLLASARPSLVAPAALCGALSSAVSMGAGEWLSDSDSGLGASAVMAGATFTGAILPALPWTFTRGPEAIVLSMLLCTAAATVVACLRPNRGPGLALAETVGLLALVGLVVVACALVLPGGAL
jgi:hypothetical protein